ncbi:unnamed protein product [Musa acuminata subsp. malaccensis]|uniref:(wild Malaysian banana) hypothetical protein n=1 Tax=Musa acuminata subsp. malaccensis TaxID=214687 RepID=A0A804L6H2_MUSAM|nr:unnamed protein product [Musa acuminata subsp. malaccensis]
MLYMRAEVVMGPTRFVRDISSLSPICSFADRHRRQVLLLLFSFPRHSIHSRIPALPNLRSTVHDLYGRIQSRRRRSGISSSSSSPGGSGDCRWRQGRKSL